MNTPWGISDHIERIEKGAHWVSTSSHGGIMVSFAKARSIFSEKAIAIAFPGLRSGYVCFEEDCSYAVAFLEKPEYKRVLDTRSLNDWYQMKSSALDSFMVKARQDAIPKLEMEVAKSNDQILADMTEIVRRWNPEYFGEKPALESTNGKTFTSEVR